MDTFDRCLIGFPILLNIIFIAYVGHQLNQQHSDEARKAKFTACQLGVRLGVVELAVDQDIPISVTKYNAMTSRGLCKNYQTGEW
jgi:hypothetical protein